jgi:hypothetical protein
MTWIWVSLISAILFAFFSDPIIIPDSYEQVIVAECWHSGISAKIDCTQIEDFFRPPLPSALIVPWLSWLDGLTALSLITFLSTVALVGILIHRSNLLLGSLVDFDIGWWVGLTILMAGLGTDLAILLDSKWLALPWLFTGAGLLMKTQYSIRDSALSAILFGCAFLCRLENILVLLLGAGLVITHSRQRLVATLTYVLISSGFIGGWVFLLWNEHQILTISPRFWESSLIPLLDEMPLRWLQDLYGMGIWNPPFREMAMLHAPSVENAPSLLSKFSFLEWGAWFRIHIMGLFHPLHWIGLIGTLPALKNVAWRQIFTALMLVSLPSIAVTLLPQGRESTFPIVYVLPLWIAIWVWTGLMLGMIADHFGRTQSTVIAVSLLLFGSWLSPDITAPQMIEKSEPGLATQHWLNTQTPDNAIVLSTFETAPIVWLANREWQEWPSPWTMQHRIKGLQETNRPIYAIVWNNDIHSWYSMSFTERYHPPMAYINKANESFVVFDLSEGWSEARPQNAF